MYITGRKSWLTTVGGDCGWAVLSYEHLGRGSWSCQFCTLVNHLQSFVHPVNTCSRTRRSLCHPSDPYPGMKALSFPWAWGTESLTCSYPCQPRITFALRTFIEGFHCSNKIQMPYFYFCGWIISILAWPQTHHVAEHVFGFLIILPSPLWY